MGEPTVCEYAALKLNAALHNIEKKKKNLPTSQAAKAEGWAIINDIDDCRRLLIMLLNSINHCDGT